MTNHWCFNVFSPSTYYGKSVFILLRENKLLLNTRRKDLRKARLFSNTFCFIDNLCAISIYLELDRNLKNVYPSELQLKKENISTSEKSFLDLSIITEEKKVQTQFYDKKDKLLFFYFFCHFDSHIPSNIYYATVIYRL